MEKVVAKGKFKLIGTDTQIAILEPVFTVGSSSYIAFAWEKITALPRYPVPISWEDLNDGTLRVHTHHAKGKVPVNPRLHQDGEAHAISRPGKFLGEPTKRLMIAGVFWTDGRIKIDIRLESRPDSAREVLSAELAHAADYGLPLSDAQKTRLVALFHPSGLDEHTWWEKQDYGREYYTLVGEGFMALFTHAYSGMTPWQDPFVHKSTKTMAPEVHRILDVYPPGQGGMSPVVKHLKGYRTFHKSGTGTHYEKQWASYGPRVIRLSRSDAISKGFVGCQVCKP